MKNVDKMSDRELRQELSAARGTIRDMGAILYEASCPNGCVNGVIVHGEDVEPCAFCGERASALARIE